MMPAKRVSLICAAITLGLASCSSSKVEDAKRAVAYDLVDPDSAKFRDVFTNGEFVCGQVNGKNRVGAYSGYERFVATQDNDKWKIVRISSGNEGYWFETCERSASANKEASKGRNACFGSWAGQGDNKLAMMVGPDVLVDYRENERAGAWHNVIAETKLKFSNAEGVDVDMVCEGETANLSRSDQESVEALRKITVLSRGSWPLPGMAA